MTNESTPAFTSIGDTVDALRENAKEYYGQVLNGTSDLKTSACCTSESIPLKHRKILGDIHPEVLDKFYGCGSPIPEALHGMTVLDLGCGSGRDCYLLSRLVGPVGRVIGVDMTGEQLEVARRHVAAQTQKWGYSTPNVEFREGFIEDLKSAGIADNSVDIVVSNCVINLSADKESVFREIFRVLKPGGELYFSDVFSGRRVPMSLKTDPVFHGECLGGALYVEDFRRLIRAIGVADHRIVASRRIELGNAELVAKAGMLDFHSLTIRAFKLEGDSALEDLCEDYGQVATYLGTIEDHPHAFVLDDHHLFETGKAYPVCGNTASMLENTRFGAHFGVIGDRSTHYGLFDCGPSSTGSKASSSTAGTCC
jgi:arsenite methyltransferase